MNHPTKTPLLENGEFKCNRDFTPIDQQRVVSGWSVITGQVVVPCAKPPIYNPAPVMKPVTHKARIERKHAKLPRYVVIPAHIPQAWELTGTTTVVGTLNGVDMGRRGLKNWGDGRRWFFELPEPLCRAAGVDTGDVITLMFAPCDPVPTEVRALISSNAAFARTWATLTPGRQRQFCEWVASAKQPSTREKRARSLTASNY